MNDEGALGRQTEKVPDPDDSSQILESDILESQPLAIPSLVEEGFRVVQAAAGDSVSVFLDAEGVLRSCGCFRVRTSHRNALNVHILTFGFL